MLKCRYNKGFEELQFFLFTDIHILQYIKINENGFNAKSGMPLNFVHKSNLVFYEINILRLNFHEINIWLKDML